MARWFNENGLPGTERTSPVIQTIGVLGYKRRLYALEAPKLLCSHCSRSVFRTEIRRVQVADDLEPVQGLHFGTQGTRTDPAVQSHCQAWRVS